MKKIKKHITSEEEKRLIGHLVKKKKKSGKSVNVYFNKRVEDLTLLDSLVLSYIIPRPKFFLPALISQSQILKKNLKLHLKKYALIMSQRELITKDEFKKIQYTIQFSKTLGKLEL